MCSRFELNTTPRALARQFSLSAAPAMPNQPEIRPTDWALVIGSNAETSLRIWGIPAPWDGKPVFNTRAETVLEKPIFKPFLAKRCVITATMFPEWRKDGKARYRNEISRGWGVDEQDSPYIEPPIMAFAGLMDETHTTIITCAAAPRMAHVHGRMPVILAGDAVHTWLDDGPIEQRASLLTPYTGNDLMVVEETPPPPKQPDLFGT